jgi:hypothetical protein
MTSSNFSPQWRHCDGQVCKMMVAEIVVKMLFRWRNVSVHGWFLHVNPSLLPPSTVLSPLAPIANRYTLKKVIDFHLHSRDVTNLFLQCRVQLWCRFIGLYLLSDGYLYWKRTSPWLGKNSWRIGFNCWRRQLDVKRSLIGPQRKDTLYWLYRLSESEQISYWFRWYKSLWLLSTNYTKKDILWYIIPCRKRGNRMLFIVWKAAW